MHHEQDSFTHCADPMPTLFTVDHAVFTEHKARI